jgi:hypothetical protein
MMARLAGASQSSFDILKIQFGRAFGRRRQ